MAKVTINNKVSHEIERVDDHLTIDGVRSEERWALTAGDVLMVTSADALRTTDIECIDLDLSAGTAVVRVNGRTYEVAVRTSFDQLLETLGMGPGSTAKLGSVKAPMPGMVLEILVTEGQNVAEGEPLLILEAMKMENVIKSPREGEISKVGVTKGTAIEKNALLVEFKN